MGEVFMFMKEDNVRSKSALLEVWPNAIGHTVINSDFKD